MQGDSNQAKALQDQAANIYTPGNPITDPKLFSGREDALRFLREEFAMNPRKCLVLYGDRGVGKTSFCNVLFDGYNVLKHNCSKNDNFITIFLNILSRSGEHFTEAERKVLAEAGYKIGVDNLLSIEGKVGAEELVKPVAEQRLDLNFVLRKFLKANPNIDVVFLDEFQNISQPQIQSEIIEVVKGIADDRTTKIITIIAGIAKSDKELLSSPDYDQYKGRHFIATKLPRMEMRELRDIIDKRKNLFQVDFNDKQKDCISYIASGLPHYVHKVALAAVFKWILDNAAQIASNLFSRFISFITSRTPQIGKIDIHITDDQFRHAIQRMISEFESNFPKEYAQLKEGLNSDKGIKLQKILQVLAGSLGEAVDVDKIEAEVNASAQEIEQILRGHLSLVVIIRDDGLLELSYSQLGPYIRSWEWLAHGIA